MNLFELLNRTEPVKSPNNSGPGPGKKKCSCGLYLGVRTKICKSCGHDFSTGKKVEIPEFILPAPVYVYEHLRTDTWEKEQIDKILARKNTLAEKQNEFHYAPTTWRPLCYSIEEVLNRRGLPYNSGITLKDDLNRIIIKCIKTDKFFQSTDPRSGLLQELVVVGVEENI